MTDNSSDPTPLPGGFTTRSRIVAALAGCALVGAAITAGVTATAAGEHTDAVAAAAATIEMLRDAQAEERQAAGQLTGAQLRAVEHLDDVDELWGQLVDLAGPTELDELTAAADRVAAELEAQGITEQADVKLVQVLDRVDVPVLDDHASIEVLRDVASSTTALAAPIQAHGAQLRTLAAELAAAEADVLAALAKVAASTAEPAAAVASAHPKAGTAASKALTAAQEAFEAAGVAASSGTRRSSSSTSPAVSPVAAGAGEDLELVELDELVAAGVAYVDAVAAVKAAHAAATAAEQQNAATFTDPATGQTVRNPSYNPSQPSTPPGGGTPGPGAPTCPGVYVDGQCWLNATYNPTHPRWGTCASEGFYGSQACMDSVPATFTTNGSYVSSCPGGSVWYAEHSPGWGGTSTLGSGIGAPWTASVSGQTVTFYLCA